MSDQKVSKEIKRRIKNLKNSIEKHPEYTEHVRAAIVEKISSLEKSLSDLEN